VLHYVVLSASLRARLDRKSRLAKKKPGGERRQSGAKRLEDNKTVDKGTKRDKKEVQALP